MEINDNIDTCSVYQYAYAMGGEIDYLYKDESRHGKGILNDELSTALLKINEEIQEGKTNPIIYDLSNLELLKLEVERFEWAYSLIKTPMSEENFRELENIFKENRIPFDEAKILSKIGTLRTQYKIKHLEYTQAETESKKKEFTASKILNSLPSINVILESRFVEAKTTSIRDFLHYQKMANEKLEQLKKRK